MAKLDLPPAKILHVTGWGKATPTRGYYVVDFSREREGSVVIAHGRNGKLAYWFTPGFLSLTVKNEAIRSGGGFIGGGLGVEGAAIGVVGGALLNALTARNRHYGMLIFSLNQPGVSPRIVVLGYENVPDVEIAQRVSAALPPFMDYWIDCLLQRVEAADDAQLAATRPHVELMAKRGWFTDEQLKRIERRLRPGAGEIDGTAVEPLEQSAIEPAKEIVAQLEQLAALHASGALTDEEFAAAKARIL